MDFVKRFIDFLNITTSFRHNNVEEMNYKRIDWLNIFIYIKAKDVDGICVPFDLLSSRPVGRKLINLTRDCDNNSINIFEGIKFDTNPGRRRKLIDDILHFIFNVVGGEGGFVTYRSMTDEIAVSQNLYGKYMIKWNDLPIHLSLIH